MGYHRPSDLREALTLLAKIEPTILAGGTDLYPATDRQEISGDVLDITALPDLLGVTRSDTHIRIGAATRWADIIAADLPASFDALKLSAREVGSIQIQNSGTIGGNLCNASPAADGVPPLLILDASVELRSPETTRRVPLSDFILGNRRTERKPSELLTAIFIPETSTAGASHFLKLGARRYLVISIGMVAAKVTMTDRKIRTAAIAIGSCSEVATRLPDIEAELIGQDPRLAQIPDDLIARALSPIDDIRASKGYRIKTASELVRRALRGIIP